MNKYLIAVSGGPDSMCLLDKYKHQAIAVCHVNYNLRSSASRDENIVKAFCDKHNITFHVLLPAYNKELDANFQNWARNVRYEFFYKIAKKHEVQTILTAHHKNDFLETAFMQLEKRVETLFLGIPKISFYKELQIYRPLLNYQKKDLINYCQKHNIDYGIDETNFSLKYKRNEVRAKLSNWSDSELNEFEKKIQTFNQTHDALNKKVHAFYKQWSKYRNVEELLKHDDDFIFHVLYLFFVDNNIKFSRNKFGMLIALMNKNNPNKLMRIGNGKNILVKKKRLFIF